MTVVLSRLARAGSTITLFAGLTSPDSTHAPTSPPSKICRLPLPWSRTVKRSFGKSMKSVPEFFTSAVKVASPRPITESSVIATERSRQLERPDCTCRESELSPSSDSGTPSPGSTVAWVSPLPWGSVIVACTIAWSRGPRAGTAIGPTTSGGPTPGV